ncbi:hypothetical protein PFISCL1PPCAC_13841, partial [Pristionchus fissidentatus]
VFRMSTEIPDVDQQTYRTRLDFHSAGRKFSLSTVYQDTSPKGSQLATVIAVHGSPGSHRDFKHITPLLEASGIRVIGVNYPGFGLTEDSEQLLHANEERTAFVEALIDRLGLTDRLLFLGHSRGGENALELAVRNAEKCIGAVLLNPFGLRLNKAIRPRTTVDNIRYYHESYPWMRPLIEWYLYQMYNRVIGLKVREGRHALAAVKTMTTVALEKQEENLAAINRNADMRVLLCYSGKDHLIETEISEEFADRFERMQRFVSLSKNCSTTKLKHKLQAFLSDASRRIAVAFPDDHHFSQAKRAKLIAQGILAIVRSAERRQSSL